MWGTIARLLVLPGAEAAFVAQGKAMTNDRMNGWRQVSLFQSAVDPREWWMLALFENEAAYKKNAASAAQHQAYLTLRSMLAADPEWHDVNELATLVHDEWAPTEEPAALEAETGAPWA